MPAFRDFSAESRSADHTWLEKLLAITCSSTPYRDADMQGKVPGEPAAGGLRRAFLNVHLSKEEGCVKASQAQTAESQASPPHFLKTNRRNGRSLTRSLTELTQADRL